MRPSSLAPSSERSFLVLATLGVLLWALTQLFLGERIPLTDGLGTYDGRRYGEIAMDPQRQLVDEGLDLFRLQRVLPSLLVHLALRVLGLPLDAPHVVYGFLALNALSQVALVPIWLRLARATGLGSHGLWLGWTLLFVSFANLKQPYFYPVLTDTPGMLLGALLLLCHLERRPLACFLVLLAAAFSWPSLFLTGVFLFAFEPAPLDSARGPLWVGGGLGVLAAAACVVLNAALLGSPTSPVGWFALVVLVSYVAVVVASLASRRDIPRRLQGAARPLCLALFAAVFIALRLSLSAISTAPGMTFGRHVRHVFLYNLDKPAQFLLGHAVYFGPVVLLLLLLWPHVVRSAHALGVGVTGYVAIQLVHAVNCESRQLVDALPLYALLAALAAERRGWTPGLTGVVAAIALLASKAWLPINRGEWGSPLAPPAQYYFMNMGPSMAPWAQQLQWAGLAIALLVIAVSLHRVPGREQTTA